MKTTPIDPNLQEPSTQPDNREQTGSMSINERRLNEILESSPDAVLIVNRTGIIEHINRQSEQLFGYSREELIGESVDRLIPMRFRESHRQFYTAYYEGDPTTREMGSGLKFFCINKAGKDIPVQISLSPIRVNSEITSLVRIRDITQEVAGEESMRLAKEKAEQANRTKSRFLAAASHDLRQPLQSISMYLGILEAQIEEAQKARILTQIRISLNTINNLLDSLLDISKLESGVVQPHVQEFPINEVLQRVYNIGLPHASEKQLRFSFVPCSRKVSSDAALLEQLFCNLVSNAVRYTTHGGHVVLGCRRHGDTLKIQVLDNGVGIPENKTGIIFNEYVQLEYQGQCFSKGLGLGLAIVKLIVDLLNLRYEITTEVNRGTAFSIYVPLAQSNGTKTVDPHTEQRRSDKSAKAMTVLLVEDDHVVLQSTSMFLDVSGFEVLPTRNLAHALQLAGHTRPDLIVADYVLSNGENGIHVVAALRELLGRNVKAVILTGDTCAERAREAAAANCEIIYKPITPDTLLDCIRKLSKNSDGN